MTWGKPFSTQPMFLRLLALLLAGPVLVPSTTQAAQKLVSIIRQSPASTWHAYVRTTEYEGASFLSLTQVAALVDGHVRWYPVSKRADLAVRGHTIRFSFNTNGITVDGRAGELNAPTVKNGDGLWIPATFFTSPQFQQVSGARLEWDRPTPLKPVKESDDAPAPKVAVPPARIEAPALPATALPKTKPPQTKDAEIRKPARNAASYGKALKRIVIDPGHGGKDPGTVGVRGSEEKRLNLLMAQELAETLREREGYEVILTRTDDSFVTLDARAELANKYNADLFISIHCNASLSPKLRGLEVYFLSEQASDPHADAVARTENASLALEGKAAPTSGQLQAVLRSLVKNANINESSALGALIDQRVGKELGQMTLGVKQAGFYVLRGAEMPAVLIEAGFLSNKAEEKLLNKSAYRKKLMQGVVKAVQLYDQRKQKERG
jgi:N-acetylmuramoyl-L-alanine amidase